MEWKEEMKKIKKLVFPNVNLGVQCPLHHPAYLTDEHKDCIKLHRKLVRNINKDLDLRTIGNKLNEIIQALNESDE